MQKVIGFSDKMCSKIIPNILMLVYEHLFLQLLNRYTFYMKIPNEFDIRISVVLLQFIFPLKFLMNFIKGFQLFHNT